MEWEVHARPHLQQAGADSFVCSHCSVSCLCIVNDFCVMGSKAVARHPEDYCHPGFCFKEISKETSLVEVDMGQAGGR